MLFADQPINFESQDSLNRKRFSDQLSRAILSWNSHEPLIIGVYGKWGDGKTSILNLLGNKLKNKSELIFFDPWYFNSQEELIQSFLSEIIQKIVISLPISSKSVIIQSYKKISRAISTIPVSIGTGPLNLSFKDLSRKGQNPIKLKDDLINCLRDRRKFNTKKIVVIVDNIDRLSPDEMLLIFKLIRLCNDFNDFIYVLAFDDRYVINALDNIYRARGDGISGEEFIKKIIQTDIRLPSIDPQIIDNFIDNGIEKIIKENNLSLDENFHQSFPQFYSKHVHGKLINNLRDAKKYLNAIAFNLPLIKGEVNIGDWLVLELIRVFSPLSYIKIEENIGLLSPDHTRMSYYWSDSDKKENNIQFTKFFEKIDFTNQEFIDEALKFLFPSYASWRVNPQNPAFMYENNAIEYSSKQRISSPDYKEAFFQYGPKHGQLTDTKVFEFINLINSDNSKDKKANILIELNEFKKTNQLKVLLDKLVIRADKINRNFDQDFIEILLQGGIEYSKEEGYFSDSEEDRVRALIFSLIAENTDADQVNKLLRNAIFQSESDYFALSVYLYSKPKRNRILHNSQLINFDSLLTAIKDRLYKSFIKESKNIFDLSIREYAGILINWSGELINDRETVQTYLTQLFKKDKKNFISFLSIFIQKKPFSDEEKYGFEIEEFKKSFSIDWLKNQIVQFPNISFELEQKKEAFDELKKSII